MDTREAKACEMTGDSQVSFRAGAWRVHSQTESRYYKVNPSPAAPACENADFALRAQPCKHIMAVRLLLERQLKGEPNPDPATIPIRPARPTYTQDWASCNLAPTNEKDHFQVLLADLCRGIPQPPKSVRGGRPAMPVALQRSEASELSWPFLP